MYSSVIEGSSRQVYKWQYPFRETFILLMSYSFTMDILLPRDLYDIAKYFTQKNLYELFESAFNETKKRFPIIDRKEVLLSQKNEEIRKIIGDITKYKDLERLKDEILGIYYEEITEEIPKDLLKQFLDDLFENLEEKIRSHPKIRDTLIFQIGLNEKKKYEARQSVISRAIDQIRMIDISEYRGNPMVERILADQVEEQREKIEEFQGILAEKIQEIGSLKVKVAVLNERYNSERVLSWVRNFVGIILGVSVSLVFLGESSLNKIGLLLVLIFTGLFILTCLFTFRREKHEQK